MATALEDYFAYLPDQPAGALWPCRVTAAGHTRIRANTPYPPQRHPVDHHFTWSRGRVLHAYQIVYIPSGSGSFESSATRKPLRIEPGSLFLLFPDVWHRYAPDIKTGWVEDWVECIGPAVVEAQQRGIIRPDRPVLRVGQNRDLIDAFALCHRWARRVSPARAAALAALGLHLLAILEGIESAAAPPTQVQSVVRAAQAIIVERFQEPLNMRDLARSLSVSYSSLRQRFKVHTGLSPKQFQLHIRLQRAQDLLLNTGRSVKEIAAILGFDSPYHFSAQFKNRTGLAPSAWRRERAASGGRGSA
jgi:AraC-like DNA-binding protein